MNRIDIKNYFFAFVFISPFLLAYLIVFYLSMSVAPDRQDYLAIMKSPFEGREEPLIHFFSYFLGLLFSNTIIKLMVLQIFFFLILIYVFFEKIKPKNLSGLVYLFAILIIFFGVFSNMLSVQLRIGYATTIFLLIVSVIKIKPKIYNIPIFLIPCFMHSGLIFAVLLYLFFHYFKINNIKSYIVFLVTSILVSTVTIKYLPVAFDYFGVSQYYFAYLDGDIDFGRKLPFTVVFYTLFCFVLLFFYRAKSDIDYWFGFSGFLLIYIGFVLDFYISFKMLTPISAFFYLYNISRIEIKSSNSFLFLIFFLLLIPLSFLMLIKQVELF